MRKPRTVPRARVLVGYLVLLALVSGWADSQPAQAGDPDTRGYISSDMWACLLPLLGNGCDGGGPEAMQENWLAPYDIASESPLVGTEWRRLGDTGGDENSRSTVFLGGPVPHFMNIGRGSEPDVVDFREFLETSGRPFDFVVGLAVTYVRNETGQSLPVELCLSSSDSVQAWLNNRRVVNESRCRQRLAACDYYPIVLAPGVNRLAIILWNGVGDFEFRVGLARRSDRTFYTASDWEIKRLGAGPSSFSQPPLPLPILTRRSQEAYSSCPARVHEVMLETGAGFDPEPDSSYEVVETIVGPADVNNVSHDGVLEEIVLPTPQRVTALDKEAFVNDAEGEHIREDGSYVSTSTSPGDIWFEGDKFPFIYADVQGDFDIAIRVTNRVHESGPVGLGRFGLMARERLDGLSPQCSRFVMVQDLLPHPDDGARVATRLGAKCADVAHHFPPLRTPQHPEFMRLTRRGDQITGWISDASELTPGGGGEPCEDGKWVRVKTVTWPNAPPTLKVGFANSVHAGTEGENVAVEQTIHFELLWCTSRPTAQRITWNVAGGDLAGAPLRYSVTGRPDRKVHLEGTISGHATGGAAALYFEEVQEPQGTTFERAHDIGRRPDCSPGTLLKGENETGEDVFTIYSGSGSYQEKSDEFFYAYQSWTGDFAAEVHFTRVQAAPNAGRWGKYGLMARWDCGVSSPFFFTHNAAGSDADCETDGPRSTCRPRELSTSNPDEDVFELSPMWWQDVFGNAQIDSECFPLDPNTRANDFRGDERNRATYLRLVRRGNTFYGYGSDDREEWISLGSYSWPDSPQTILVGVAVTSGADCEVQEVTFEEFSIVPLAALRPAVEKPELRVPRVLVDENFDDAPAGQCPPGWDCTGWGAGEFRPEAHSGRLRLATQGSGDVAGNHLASTAFLQRLLEASGSYRFEFDLFFRFVQELAEEVKPGNGLTFSVLGVDGVTEPTAPVPGPRVGDFHDTTIGWHPCPDTVGDNFTTYQGGEFITRCGTGRDIWSSGDHFQYVHRPVRGDFDFAVEILDRRLPEHGRWGKFGLMARQSLEYHSRFSAVQDHGPWDDLGDDAARFASRQIHRQANSVKEHRNTKVETDWEGSLRHPDFLRLTRIGDRVTAYVSNVAGDGTEPLAPENWVELYQETWPDMPETVHLGFFFSVHSSSVHPETEACEIGEVDWRVLFFHAEDATTDLAELIPVPTPRLRELTVGDRGSGLGYARINQSLNESLLRTRALSRNSFSVEFDNWYDEGLTNDASGTNTGRGWNPDGGATQTGSGPYHVGLNVNGSVHSVQRNLDIGVHDQTLPDIYHPRGVHVKVTYDNGHVKAWIRSRAQGFISGGGAGSAEVQVLDAVIDPVAFNAPFIQIGFTTGTSDKVCRMEVDNLTVADVLAGDVFFHRGDFNGDGDLEISDAIAMLNWLFVGGQRPPSCEDAADFDDKGSNDISDAIGLLNFLFAGGPPPAQPGPTSAPCGPDTTPDALSCREYEGCR